MLTSVELLVARLAARRNDESGAAMVEYALLLALIGVGCVGAVRGFGVELNETFRTITDAL